ncbi:MAG: hypothetical protein ACK4UQ_05490 [Brevundimonas sp.]
MTINLSTSLTIEAGETYSSTSGATFYMAQHPAGWVFRNYGSILASGAGATAFLGWNARGLFVNEGLIRVTTPNGLGHCLSFESVGPKVVNTGRIELLAAGSAIRSWEPDQVIENSGVIFAGRPDGLGATAIWSRNGLNLNNTGQIIAEGSSATAINLGELYGQREISPGVFVPRIFKNDGLIQATNTVEGGGLSRALIYTTHWGDDRLTAPNIINNGVMRADRVIWWTSPDGTPTTGHEWVANHGEMYGTVSLNNGDDRFISDGIYIGFLDMGDGHDVIDLSASIGAVTGDLGNGDDVFIGGQDRAEINASSGNDHVSGGRADDHLIGSAGDDIVSGGGGDDLLEGHQGRDWLEGGDGGDILIGDVTFEDRWIPNNDDVLLGGGGDDRLMGGMQNDTLDGGEGMDTAIYIGLRADYRISTVDGITTVVGREGSDTLTGVERLEFFDGVYGIDGQHISRFDDPTSGDDIITGSIDTDRIHAGAGNDVITARGGRDYIDGGSGYDVVWLEGRIEDYKVVAMGDDFLITAWHTEGKYLTNVELVRFAGGGALDLAREVSPLISPNPSAVIGSAKGDAFNPFVLPDVAADSEPERQDRSLKGLVLPQGEQDLLIRELDLVWHSI